MTRLARAGKWFLSRGWKPFRFQRDVWKAYLAGDSGLLHASTGAGKTYAVWIAALAEGGAEAHPPLRVLWVTPLRALAADLQGALREPLAELAPGWRVETRTGDTAAGLRARQDSRLPAALITTPESLTLLLSRPGADRVFRHLRLVVADEWHELLSTKRGVQMELALARLRTFVPDLRVWGLSATIGNLDAALDALLGGRPGRIVRGAAAKRLSVDAILPAQMERFPWAGHLGVHLLEQTIAEIEQAGTCLLFTNTRSQTEIWYQALLAARPDWAGEIAVHHGSLDRQRRDWVEAGLRRGSLRCVVCTSSLDLGVDFQPVDRVLQVGSPRGVGRLVQRAGRSGHRPGAASRITCVPTHAFELVEAAAVRDAALAGRIEAREPLQQPLDVLVQHLVTVACGGGFRAPDLLREVRSTHAYRHLPDDSWNWALDFVTRGGDALRAYPEYRRVSENGGVYTVTDPALARRHRMTIGAITSDGALEVRYVTGGRLGTVEESFVSRLRPGDNFVFAGRTLELVRVHGMRADVRRVPANRQAAVPRWEGSRMPLSSELSHAVRVMLDAARRGFFGSPEMETVRPVLEVQAAWSRIPALDEMLIERVRTREGWHLFFFPFAGHLAHEGMAALIAWRLARRRPITFSMAANDYGFELLSADPPPIEEALADGLFSSMDLENAVLASLNEAEMARRQFREIARVAGLVFPGYPGNAKPVRHLQASSGLLFDVFSKYDPANPLLAQARQEVLEKQLDCSRLRSELDRLAASRILLTDPPRPTPLGFPLLIDISRARLSSEKLADRVRRMVAALEEVAG